MQATYLATLRKVEDRSTFLATRNATIAVAKWGVTRDFFPPTCNATNVALQVARKIASCNMAFKDVRANCFCASLLRTQIHATSSMSARALSIKINNDREDDHCCSFAWI